MSRQDQAAGDSTPPPARWRDKAGCLASLLAWLACTEVPQIIRPWPWFYQVPVYLAAVSLGVLVAVRRIHGRRQTVTEAIAARRAEQAASRIARHRQAAARTRASEAVAALPWMHDKRLVPAAVPGVLITPVPDDLPGYQRTGYDV